jgi:hypothetical protein
MNDFLPCSLARVRGAAEFQLRALAFGSFHVLTQWLRGHQWAVAEIIAFPIFTGDRAALDHMEAVLAVLPGVYRLVRITGGRFGRNRGDLRPQVRALVAMNAVAFDRKPLGRGGWAEPNPDHPGIEFRNPVQC